MQVTKVNFNKMEKWFFSQSEIYNRNKNFFSIIPYKFKKNNKTFFYQPLIIQKEVGILGILKKKSYFFLQLGEILVKRLPIFHFLKKEKEK